MFSAAHEQTDGSFKMFTDFFPPSLQIINATVDNSKLVLDIDNNRMTADDFRLK